MQNKDLQIHYAKISARTVLQVCQLSDTLSPEHRQAVADNAISIAQGHFSKNVWMRAIYSAESLVGFIMLHIGSDWEDGIDCQGVFLWRLMIAEEYQGKGMGKSALLLLIDHLKALGIPRLYTS
jgi:diamine N-acetyltransferase